MKLCKLCFKSIYIRLFHDNEKLYLIFVNAGKYFRKACYVEKFQNFLEFVSIFYTIKIDNELKITSIMKFENNYSLGNRIKISKCNK